MKQRCAKAVNIAADVLRLVAQLARHTAASQITRRSVDVALRAASQSPIFAACSSTNKCWQASRRDGQAFRSCAKSSRDLDANVEHLCSGAALRLHEIIETSVTINSITNKTGRGPFPTRISARRWDDSQAQQRASCCN
jgi:hypothetical protein